MNVRRVPVARPGMVLLAGRRRTHHIVRLWVWTIASPCYWLDAHVTVLTGRLRPWALKTTHALFVRLEGRDHRQV